MDLLTADEAEAAPADLLDLIRWLTLRLKRRPSYGEVLRARVQIARHRSRRHRPKAAPPPARTRAKGEAPDAIVREVMGGAEMRLFLSAALAALQIGGALASQAGAALASAARPRVPPPKTLPVPEPDPFAQARARRREAARRRYGDADYPSALRALLRTSGRPRLPIRGRDAWGIVDRCRPEVAQWLRECGDDWRPARRHVWLSTDAAAIAALRAQAAGRQVQAPTKPPKPVKGGGPAPTPAPAPRRAAGKKGGGRA